MFDELQALHAVSATGSVTRAALQLRISQPALSKRLRNLETTLKKKLIERVGRGVTLTTYAQHLCAQTAPLFAELREILSRTIAEQRGPIPFAITDSSMVSWGAEFLGRLRTTTPELQVRPIVLPSGNTVAQQVMAGEALVGIIRGTGERTPGLHVVELIAEPLCLVPAHFKPLKLARGMKLEILCVESAAESYQIALRRLKRLMPAAGIQFRMLDFCRSGPAVIAAAKAGLGHGLIGIRLARVMGVPEKVICPLPSPGISMPTSLVARKRALELEHVGKLVASLKVFFASSH